MATKEERKLRTSIKDLLECGAHFGHQAGRWNPKMRSYIFEERNGLHIIDLAKTMQQLRDAVDAVQAVVAKGGSILFVGTKKQAKGVIQEAAEQCGELFVADRWLGGTLTNLATIRQSINKLERIEKEIANESERFTKKELSKLTKLQLKLERNLGGVRNMRKPPGMVVVVDPNKEHIAVAEARTLNIPVMALVDTNCNPDPIDYVIACNDDALKSVKLIVEELAQAIIDKKNELTISITREFGEESKAKEAANG